jgi:hypothetical protein
MCKLFFTAALSLVALLGLAHAVEHPWSVGVAGGMTMNRLEMGGAETYRLTIKYESEKGWTASVPVRYQALDWLAVSLEPGVNTKNYSWKRTGDYEGLFANRLTNTFLDVPLLASLSWPIGRTRLFASGGASLSYWLWAREKGFMINITQSNTFYSILPRTLSFKRTHRFTASDNRLQAGLLAGAGLEHTIGAFSLRAEGRYHHSLTDLQKQTHKSQAPSQNRAWSLQLALLVTPGLLGGSK